MIYVYSNQNPSINITESKKEILKSHYSLNNTIKNIELKEDIPISYIEASTKYKYSFDQRIIDMDKKIQTHKKIVRSFDELRLELIKTKKEEIEFSSEKLEKLLNKMKINLANSKINNIEDKEHISLKPKLEFLRKSIYEDRNLLFHGKLNQIDHHSKLYFYLMGINRLLDIFEEMELLYN